MKLVKRIALVLLFLLLFIPARSARADMAPPPAPGLGGLRPLEYQATEVQMVYERVELTLRPIPPSSTDEISVEEQVDVTAWFVLRNTGIKDEEMKAAFPLGSLNFCDKEQNAPRSWGTAQYSIIPDSFKVTINGTTVPTEITQIEGIECVNWTTFYVRFPVNEDVLIKVDYSMQTNGTGHDLLLQYILETGAGWKGPIKQAYIVFRFPYLATTDNVNSTQTTPGYQSLYNEIFWSYRDLEPTPNDNINIDFFEPRTWMNIQTLQEQVAKTPTDAEAWSKLFAVYEAGMPYNADTIRASFENAVKANPNNADFYAKYADFLNSRCCVFKEGDTIPPVGAKENVDRQVIPLLNHALALDPQNKTALEVLDTLRWVFPDLTYTPPPTIPPTATPAVSSTPTVTSLPSITPKPSQTPEILEVTVVQTQIVSATPESSTATPTTLPATTLTPAPSATSKNNGTTGANWILWSALLLVGFIGGVFVSKKKWI